MAESICKALLIGNSVFEEDPHNLPELMGPVNDLPMLRDALTDPDLGLFAPDNVRLLPERNKREIATAMEEFFRNAGRDDMLLLYYSGHGKQDDYDNLYLCARDTRTDLLVSTGISDVEMNGIMRTSPAQTFIVILDCCHSGAFKGGGLPSNLRGSGRFLLSSSRRGQLSSDAAEVSGPSLFTRHLAEAMTLGTLDENRDGYVSLNEVYNYVLARLGEESKQIPQRQFDKSIGDPALARARAGAHLEAPPAPTGRDAPPRLEVSETDIHLRGVQPEEVLPPEIVDVFNSGGGELDWTVVSEAAWIEAEPDVGFFRLTFNARPGVNRGNVRVRDRTSGGSRTVRVVVEVLERQQPPALQLSDPAIDFGVLSHGVESPRRTVQLLNVGGGELEARARSVDPWIDVHQFGDAVSVLVDTSVVGELTGSIVVESRGGTAHIAVRAVVEPGPLLRVEPRLVDFGRLWAGQDARVTLSVGNAGRGELQWNCGMRGDFFRLERVAEGLVAQLQAAPGSHVGSIWVGSNGGEVTIDVRADVVARPPVNPRPPAGPPPLPPRAWPPPPRRRHRARALVITTLVVAVIGVMIVGALEAAKDLATSTTTASREVVEGETEAVASGAEEVCINEVGAGLAQVPCSGEHQFHYELVEELAFGDSCSPPTDFPFQRFDGALLCLLGDHEHGSP